MDNNLNVLGLISSFLSITLANIQQVLSIISLIISMLFTVFLIIKAVRNAFKDGKITKEEVDEVIDLTKDVLDKGKQLEDKISNQGEDNKNV